MAIDAGLRRLPPSLALAVVLGTSAIVIGLIEGIGVYAILSH